LSSSPSQQTTRWALLEDLLHRHDLAGFLSHIALISIMEIASIHT
jgi:hypothetical protein